MSDVSEKQNIEEYQLLSRVSHVRQQSGTNRRRSDDDSRRYEQPGIFVNWRLRSLSASTATVVRTRKSSSWSDCVCQRNRGIGSFDSSTDAPVHSDCCLTSSWRPSSRAATRLFSHRMAPLPRMSTRSRCGGSMLPDPGELKNNN